MNRRRRLSQFERDELMEGINGLIGLIIKLLAIAALVKYLL